MLNLEISDILSEQGRSWCTYLFSGRGDHLAGLVPAISAEASRLTGNFQVYTDDIGQLVVRVDHQVVDAQRGLAIVLRALGRLNEADSGPMPVIPIERVSKFESHSVVRMDQKNMLALAKNEGRTLTQLILSRLLPLFAGEDSLRLIVSAQAGVNSEAISGNHFVPVDITAAALEKMVTRPSAVWKKLLGRLVASAEAAMPVAGCDHFPSATTITSVGDLSAAGEQMSDYGITGMTMFPENVSFCPRIITIYSIFSELNLVFSGSDLPEKSQILALLTDEGGMTHALS